jgi:hypothetical protein
MMLRTSLVESEPSSPSINATSPATWGVAIDVPENITSQKPVNWATPFTGF